MTLYDSKYVYFDWDDNLEGKEGFFDDNIESLKQNINDDVTLFYGKIVKNLDNDNNFLPFGCVKESGWGDSFRFCYYDPYYEFRKAYLEGKQLQFKSSNCGWEDIAGEPTFASARDKYRIKPEVWYVVFDGYGLYLTDSKKDSDVMFDGTEEECTNWIEKYEDIILAWKQGKTIQYKDDCLNEWVNWIVYEFPPKDAFDKWKEWRVKDECEELVPFDTVQELIDAWDNKHPQSKNRPEDTMPLIWIKNKDTNCIYLIDGYDYESGLLIKMNVHWIKLEDLFNNYTFSDGSIIGKVKEIKGND